MSDIRMTDLDYMGDFRSEKNFVRVYNRKNNTVKSTYTNFVVMKPSTAIKPGKKKRIRVGKSGKKLN